MSKDKKIVKETKKFLSSPFNDYWNKRNYIFIGAGLMILIIGYLLMAQGKWDSLTSLSLSPIIILIGYFILIPLSIFSKQPRSDKKNSDVSS